MLRFYWTFRLFEVTSQSRAFPPQSRATGGGQAPVNAEHFLEARPATKSDDGTLIVELHNAVTGLWCPCEADHQSPLLMLIEWSPSIDPEHVDERPTARECLRKPVRLEEGACRSLDLTPFNITCRR